MAEEEKTNFLKVAVKPDVKREIDIIAASEQRHVYEVVDDMLKLYQAVAAGKAIPPPTTEKKRSDAERRDPVAA